MSHIEIIDKGSINNPHCPHGPTILFSRVSNGKRENFYACAACRDRKDCSFYLKAEELEHVSEAKKKQWNENKEKLIKSINHKTSFFLYVEISQLPSKLRCYCLTCYEFIPQNSKNAHENHNILEDINEYKMSHPSEIFVPLSNAKKEAQFLFSKKTVETVTNILRERNLMNVICMGTPRIHEYISAEYPDMSSILLDIDKRYHSFFGPLQFCWYNMFNHHFFLPNTKQIFYDFLQNNKGKNLVLIMDPPFGGRVELLFQTICTIDKDYKNLNGKTAELPVLWIFPYFMEAQIINRLPQYFMLDYKINYDNHSLFKTGPKARKLGSPIRIFTNIKPSLITLPIDEGYKHCELCSKWVSAENKHCMKCNDCTSKDGRTYVHCKMCQRCIKPTWIHCQSCKKCAQPDHNCQKFPFTQACFHCKEVGHKKRECPQINHEELMKKRKKGMKFKPKKQKRM